MVDVGIVKQVLGQGFLQDYGLKPWWEVVHSAFAHIYLAFLITFTIDSSIHRPPCIQISGNRTKFSPMEANFISDTCSSQSDSPPGVMSSLSLLWYYLLAEAIANFVYVKMNSSFLGVFAKAEDVYSQLKLPTNTLKSLAVRACFTKESRGVETSMLREVTSDLWWCQTRSSEMLILGSRNFMITGVIGYCVWNTAKNFAAPYANCIIKDFDRMSNETMTFECSRSLSRQYVLSYLIILCFHLALRIGVVLYLTLYLEIVQPRAARRRQNASQKSLLSLEILRRKVEIMHLVNMRHASRPYDEKGFENFVKYIFSDDAVNKIRENQKMVGGRADPEFAELASKVLGDNQFLQTGPNLRLLVKNREWKWIVAFIERGKLEAPRNIDMKAIDSKNRSLLFYALKRKRDSDSFNLRATEVILKFTPLEERVVCSVGQEIPAKVFVEQQYLKDPTYPKRLKDYLIELIESPPRQDGVQVDENTKPLDYIIEEVPLWDMEYGEERNGPENELRPLLEIRHP